ncbi:SAV_2336 N-terminal domain-related protein [Paractinoplanes rishiriensis]|uniref:Uncharacterized protein n=1 Tax=Paractinoplanes rishiriensis TaxID=1050105 RepID=A0A919MT60_9ACTN|nr:SAV_2336 N-terminal domain-related protein [Actinoplanes rishiriensis]GIE98931.1 hypothetical protein Ari01nite_63960 [Actinoplanes rishiriensis]
MTDEQPSAGAEPSETVARLIEALSGSGIEPAPEEIADAIWLATHLRSSGAGPPAGAPVRSGTEPAALPEPAEVGPPALPPTELVPPARSHPSAHSQPSAQALPPAESLPSARSVSQPAGGGPPLPPAEALQPGPALLEPLAVSRALRPLRLTGASLAEQILDEDASAEQTAEAGRWTPVLRAAPERLLDLCLVADESRSMVMWRGVIRQLSDLMRGVGAFRTVTAATLGTEEERAVFRVGSRISSWADILPGNPERRLVLFVTDSLSPWWRSETAARLLEWLADQGPVGLGHVMPFRLWRRCGLRYTPVRMWTERPAQPTADVHTRSQDGAGEPRGVAIPVFELSPRWLERWTAMVSGRSGTGIYGAAIYTGALATAAPERPPADRTADDLVRRFQANASPAAVTLARNLAAAPVTLATMRLIRTALQPQTAESELAEVFLGGLLQRTSPAGPAGTEDYDFRPGVREILLRGLPAEDALAVLTRVSEFLTARAGTTLNLPALLAGGSELVVSPADRPFAAVSAQVLRSVGGRYGDLAARLFAALPPEDRPPGPFPPPPVWADRDAEIADALRDGLAVVQGAGARTVATGFTWRQAGPADVLWLDASTPALLRWSLCARATRFGLPGDLPPATGYRRVLAALATDARRPLVVLDRAGPPAEIAPLLPDRPAGLLVVSDHPGWARAGTVIEAGHLTRRQAGDLLAGHGVPPDRRPGAIDRAGGDPTILEVLGRAWRQGGFEDWVTGGPGAYLRGLDRTDPVGAELLRLAAAFAAAPIPEPVLVAALRRPAAAVQGARGLVARGLLDDDPGGAGLVLPSALRSAFSEAAPPGGRHARAVAETLAGAPPSAHLAAHVAALLDPAQIGAPIGSRSGSGPVVLAEPGWAVDRAVGYWLDTDPAEAARLAENAWLRRDDMLGAGHFGTVAAGMLLGRALLNDGRPAVAAGVLRDCERRRGRRVPPDPGSVEALCRLGEFDAAHRLARRRHRLADHRGELADPRGEVVSTGGDLAWCAWWSGRVRQAAGLDRTRYLSTRGRSEAAVRWRHEFHRTLAGHPPAPDLSEALPPASAADAQRLAHLSLLRRHRGEPAAARDAAAAAVAWYDLHATAATLWDSLVAAARLAAAWRALGELDEAAAAGRLAHQQACDALGPRHVVTSSLVLDHAATLLAAGECEAGRLAAVPALYVLRPVLGIGHPIVLSGLGILASAQAGDAGAAAATGRRAVAASRAALGRGHPITVALAANWRLDRAAGPQRGRPPGRRLFDLDLPLR